MPMSGPVRASRWFLAILAAAAIAPAAVLAYDISDKLSVAALLAIAGQCQQLSEADDADSVCRGAVPFQAELSFALTERDAFVLKLGAAAGNGLNTASPFALAPWAADLEDDVKDINGRDRRYLLEAKYVHTFALGADNSLEAGGGLIDPTGYVNANAYANDEYTQFMNEIFVNARSAFIPSYDAGGVLVWSIKDFTLTGVGMNIGENDDGRNYAYYAAEAAYRVTSSLGEGNYRLMYSRTSRAFLDDVGESVERRSGWHLSLDQALGSVVGLFVRFGLQADDALIDYKTEYSGGLDFKGAAWGREDDGLGVGLAYLEGADASGISRTKVLETYYRFAVNDYLALTADVQYMRDDYRQGDDMDGWILGARAVAEF